jgi:hypothetical protein
MATIFQKTENYSLKIRVFVVDGSTPQIRQQRETAVETRHCQYLDMNTMNIHSNPETTEVHMLESEGMLDPINEGHSQAVNLLSVTKEIQKCKTVALADSRHTQKPQSHLEADRATRNARLLWHDVVLSALH